jgi:hypothetical protein
MRDIGFIACAGLSFGLIAFWLIRNLKRFRERVRNARILDPDGQLRQPTQEESLSISMAVASERGRHFWHLLLGGILLIGIVWVVMKGMGMIGDGKP